MSNTDHDHKNCIAMFEKLSEYIDKELDELTCKDIEAHMEHCPPCQVCLGTLKRTINLCKQMEEKPVSETLSFRLRDAIKVLVEQKNL